MVYGISFLVLLLFVAPAGVAAAEVTGTLTGTVVDETGGVLPGVVVNLRADGAEFSSVTDDMGKWSIDGVPAGPATLTFRLINFAGAHRELSVAPSEVLTVDVVLVLSLTADVVVTAERTFRNIADLPQPAENLVGIASAASVGAITAAQLQARPILRPGEVLETVPGLIISQHSGEGKANQYYLRGFNLDHGTDFATTVAGVPLNMPSGAHATGYSDSNMIIPELVSGIQFRKGPYFAEDGDFSAAGSANVSYLNLLEQPVASISTGGQGWSRIFSAASPRLGDGNLLVGVEVGRNDGPWVEPDDLRKVNGILRYSRGDARNGFSITGLSYSANWHATDQVPVRAIESGRIDRFEGIDTTGGGRTYRHGFVADSLRSNGETSTRITAFGMRYGLNLLQNFTYFLADPVDGDQFEQVDRRTSIGVKLTQRRLRQFLGRPVEWMVGTQSRHDDAGVIGLYDTVRQRRTSTVREDALRQTSLGVFGKGVLDWTSFFRTSIGLRADAYRFAVDAGNPLNAGAGVDSIVSPKLTAVLGPWQQTEFYVNWGEGFHSNDVRVATIRVDPRTGEPARQVPSAGQGPWRRNRCADGEAARAAFDGGALASGLRFRAGLSGRCGGDGAQPPKSPLRHRVVELYSVHTLDDGRRRSRVHRRAVLGRRPRRAADSGFAQPRFLRRRHVRAGEALVRERTRAPFRTTAFERGQLREVRFDDPVERPARHPLQPARHRLV